MKRRCLLSFTIALMLACTLTFGAEKGDPSKLGPLAVCADKLLDINNASLDQLQGLPGLDYAYCKKIIAGRPYSRIDQLVSKNIIPADTYEMIKNKIVIE